MYCGCAGFCAEGDWSGIGDNLGAVCSVVIVTVKAKSANTNLAIRRLEGNQGIKNTNTPPFFGSLRNSAFIEYHKIRHIVGKDSFQNQFKWNQMRILARQIFQIV